MSTRRAVSLVTLVCLVGLLVPNLSVSATNQTPDGPAQVVRVPAAAMSQVEALGLAPRLSLDYGSFTWLELSRADLARLAAGGVPFVAVPEAGQIQVPGYRFDPVVNGEPALPAAMRTDGSGPGLRLIQLAGPAQDRWLAQLEAAGLQPLQYYPHDTYLVWATAAEAEAAVALDFVRWQGAFHPGYKMAANLEGRTGRIENVDVMFYNDGDLDATLAAMNALGATIVNSYPSQPDRAFYDAVVAINAAALEDVAGLNTVLWLGYLSPEPALDDEMSTQIVAGNYIAGVPQTGYFSWLAGLGYDGSGVIWSITDTGVDYDHPDLNIVGGYTYPGCPAGDGPGDDPSTGGHGTHVAGITGGDATGGFTDGSGFYYGLGIAPGYSIFAQNPICSGTVSWPPAGGWQELSKQGVLGHAIGANNSWTSGEGTNHGYQSTERTHDFMVRDGNFDTTGIAEPYILVFSAGNSGPSPSTLTSPKEAKNLIVTAGTQNYRVASNIDAMYTSSSRGPAVDGRYVPTIAAPGQLIASTRNDLGGSCGTAIPGTNGLYSFCTGTSMASPHASGSVVLITEWWRDMNAGADPSPAMAKALLVNGAVDITGAPPIPNFDEGWGRLNLINVLDNGANMYYQDQVHTFDNAGETWTVTVGVPDPSKPLKISAAWSDAPGAVGANPALVNNLDLVVENGGNTYLGNHFSAGWSTPGGSPDTLNNLENVFVQAPGGSATITIQATNLPGDGVPISGDATDQDFALVCYNCALQADFTLAATPGSQDVCMPSDAAYEVEVGSILGFDDPVTLSAGGQPAGTTAGFSVNPVAPPGLSTLTIGNTGAAAAGSYEIDIVGVAPTSTHTTTVGLNLFSGVPGAVSLVSPVDGAVDVPLMPTFEWTAASQAASYTLEVASDPGFGDVVYSAIVEGTTHDMAATLESATLYFWRVSAQNACGAGAYSATFDFTTRDVPPILLVDDDDNGPDVRSYYTSALDALGYAYDIWDTANSNNEPDAAYLSSYRAVVWFSGDEYGGAAGPGAPGEAALAAFLDTGKCLFLSSQDYYFDMGLTAFAQNYLGLAAATNDDGNYTSVTGAGSVFGGLGPYALVYPITDYSDRLTPNASAEAAFVGNNGYTGAIDKDSGVYRTTFWGFGWEAISPATNREEALGTALEWCGLGMSIELAKTVGTDPAVCATTSALAVAPGTDVYYCYEVENTGLYTLSLHDLVDSELGTIFAGLAYDLAPGASVNTVAAGLTVSATITETTVNVATWTAYEAAGASVSDSASAQVTILPPSIALTKTVGTEPGVCAATQTIEVAPGTDVYYCYAVENTGDYTLPLHDLVDSELGTVFAGLAYDLAPGASVNTVAAGLTVSATITETTANTATWTAYLAGGPEAVATDEATVTVLPPSIELSKTVGTDPATCATTEQITVTAGMDVYYCYEVENTGTYTLPLHDLEDSELGTIFAGLAYDLGPGASVNTVAAGLTLSATITETTVNTATWTAYFEGGPSAVASDAATVVAVAPFLELAKTVGTDPAVCATTDLITVTVGTPVYYCYEITNTGTYTLPLHDLADSELGTIFSGLAYDLGPGASVDTVAAGLTVSATISATTVNAATWTAYAPAHGVVASASDMATVIAVERPGYRFYLPVVYRSRAW